MEVSRCVGDKEQRLLCRLPRYCRHFSLPRRALSPLRTPKKSPEPPENPEPVAKAYHRRMRQAGAKTGPREEVPFTGDACASEMSMVAVMTGGRGGLGRKHAGAPRIPPFGPAV